MLDRLRLKRLERHYRKIALLETKIHDVRSSFELRNLHAWDTLNRVDHAFKAKGIGRDERRRFRRSLMAGSSSRSRYAVGAPSS